MGAWTPETAAATVWKRLEKIQRDECGCIGGVLQQSLADARRSGERAALRRLDSTICRVVFASKGPISRSGTSTESSEYYEVAADSIRRLREAYTKARREANRRSK